MRIASRHRIRSDTSSLAFFATVANNDVSLPDAKSVNAWNESLHALLIIFIKISLCMNVRSPSMEFLNDVLLAQYY